MAPPLAIRAPRAALEAVIRRWPVGPVFEPSGFTWLGDVERHGPAMRAEALAVLERLDEVVPFSTVLPGQRALTQGERWRSYFLVALKRPVDAHARACPATMQALAGVPGLLNAFYSILAPDTVVPVHRGPYAGVLRLHVGLVVPDGDVGMRVDGQPVRWQEGRSVVFDDSYPHEVWNRTPSPRVVLFVDFERPLPRPLGALNLAILGLVGASAAAEAARKVVDDTVLPNRA